MWLLTASVRQAFERAESSGAMPTAQQQFDYEARLNSASDHDCPGILTIAGNNAEIEIRGAITNRPSLMAFMFGGGNTTYSDIISAIAIAEQDPEVDNITLAIDSPGGTIAGLFDALAAIENATKPTKAVVSNMGASAAFAIASKADRIIATNRATMLGSVGIVVRGFVEEGDITITSTDAPKKAPDLSTEEGRAIVREELDALHEIFVEAIASGRGTTVEKVNADFGQGATLLAEEALKRGMIDGIVGNPLKVVDGANSTTTALSGGNNSETGPMALTLTELQAQNPDVYAAAVKLGETQERDRVTAHLVAGEMSGDLKTALSAAKDGTEMTMTLQTQYMMAAANRTDTTNRQDDEVGADAADGVSDDDESRDTAASDKILNSAAAHCGIEMEA